MVGVPVGPRSEGRPVAPDVAALRRLVVETDPGVLPAQDRVDEGVLLLCLYLGEGAAPSTGALVLRIVVTQLLRGEFVALRPSVSDVLLISLKIPSRRSKTNPTDKRET